MVENKKCSSAPYCHSCRAHRPSKKQPVYFSKYSWDNLFVLGMHEEELAA